MEIYRHHSKVEAYVFGKLSQADAQALEQEAQEDEALRELIHLYQLEYRGMELLLQAQLRKKINRWNANRKKSWPLSFLRNRYMTYYLSAAAMIGLLFCLWVLWPTTPQQTQAEIALAYTPTYEYQVRGLDQPDSLQLGLQLLQDAAYQEAIAFFKDCTEQSPQAERCALLLGHAYFQQGNAQPSEEALHRAREIFEPLATQSSQKAIREYASWYLCLLPLIEGKDIPWDRLREIAGDPNHLFYQKSQQLRKALSN
ncbi:MAG: tetratricopeptide repeat protein [Bacteroidota bacterium]